MSSSHTSLEAAATERKARLAKLRSLKRKNPPTDDSEAPPGGEPNAQEDGEAPTPTAKYLSGRNYDQETRGPKLGFENNPTADQYTLEKRAQEIAEATSEQARKEQEEDKPLDLFKLQPKKPNWDLKRDVNRKLERLNVQTDNAIARLVRERIAAQKKKQMEKANGDSNGDGEVEVVGLQGEELVEGVHQREREEAEEERREREEEDYL